MNKEHCSNCPSSCYSHNAVPGDGSNKSELVIVSDMPWKSEVASGKPFTGPAGNLLWSIVNTLGFKREDFYVTNACKCPVKAVKMDTVKHCGIYLERELDSCKKKKLILAMGEKALRAILPGIKEGVMKMCGKTYHSKRYNCEVLACMNPARVLQQERDFQLFRATLSKIPNAKNGIKPIGDYLPPILSNPHISELEKMAGKDVCLDIETNATLDYMSPHSYIESIAFTDGEKVLIYDDSYFDRPSFWRAVKGTRIIAHNGPFDLIFILKKYGIELHLENDTMMMAFSIAESFGAGEEGGYKLEKLCCIYLGVAPWKSIARSRGYTDAEYQAKDVYYCWLLWKMWIKQMPKIYHSLYMPLTNSRIRTELGGVNADVDKIKKMKERFQNSINLLTLSMRKRLEGTVYMKQIKKKRDYHKARLDLWEIIYKHIKKDKIFNPKWMGPQITLFKKEHRDTYRKCENHMLYNPNSDQQNEEVFRAVLKEAGISKRLKDTSRDSILPYKHLPFFKAYIPFTILNTISTTFLTLKHIKEDGRVHPTQKIHGTVTGRISMAKPNMQNIPKKVRHIYIPDNPGQVWIKGDYDQLEMKIPVALANLVELKEEINKGFDFHSVTAMLITGKDPDDISEDERRIAKNVNFGCLFGGSDETIQEYMMKLGKRFTLFEVSQFRERYFSAFIEWSEQLIKEGMKRRFVETEYGSRRRFFLVTRQNYQAVRREMVNTRIQGTAAQMLLFRYLEIEKGTRETWGEARVLFPVHDEVDCIARKEHSEDVAEYIKEVMEKPFHFTDLIFTAGVKVRGRWH